MNGHTFVQQPLVQCFGYWDYMTMQQYQRGHFTCSCPQPCQFHTPSICYYYYPQSPVNYIMQGVTYYGYNQWINPVQYNLYGTMQRQGNRDMNEVATTTTATNPPSNIHKTSKGHNRQNQNGNSSGGNVVSSSNKRQHDTKGHTHQWLGTTLKGHTSDIRDMDFSSNGKYLASCAEDLINDSSNSGQKKNDLTSSSTSLSSTSSSPSSSSANDDLNSSSSNEDAASITYHPTRKTNKKQAKRNRKQKKNQHRAANRQNYSTDIDEEYKENQQTTTTAKKSGTKTNDIATVEIRRKISSSSTSSSSSSTNGKSYSSVVSSGTAVTSAPMPLTPINNQHRLSKLDNSVKISRAVTPPLREHTKLNLKESNLVNYLGFYVIQPHLLRVYGYPVESAICEHAVEIFKCSPKPFMNNYDGKVMYKVNKFEMINKKYDPIQNVSDSGQESGSSSQTDTDNSETEDIFPMYSQSLEKKCVRCKRSFYISNTGVYLTREECIFHWGKINSLYSGHQSAFYSCCGGDVQSEGCTRNRLHVWSGLDIGINGPYPDFVKSDYGRNASSSSENEDSDENSDEADIEDDNRLYNKSKQRKAYALDCEMCYTVLGMEAVKITVVGSDGQLVYEYLIKPKGEIVDYNTRFSGVTEKDLNGKNVKTLEEVQQDLLKFINADTILIGHALDNDLRALKFMHKTVVDTSVTFPHASGFPYKNGLKALTKQYLKRDIQTSETGHSSFEDSRACLELMLWRVRKDHRIQIEKEKKNENETTNLYTT